MGTRAIQRDDIVLVNKRGRLFYARVQGLGAAGGLSVVPLERSVSHRQAGAGEIVDHWSRAGRDPGDAPPAGQTSFDDLMQA
jgi:hypothetical protein